MSIRGKVDVLVVYNSGLAVSSKVSDSVSLAPFPPDSNRVDTNLAYAYFLNELKKADLKAGFAVSEDIIAAGTCSAYWTIEGKKWIKHVRPVYSEQIFDKVSPTSLQREKEIKLLFSDPVVKPFKNRELFRIFADKLETFKTFPKMSIPTVSIRSSPLKSIEESLARLEKLISQTEKKDFSFELILKDRYGASGEHVYKISRNFSSEIQKIMWQHPNVRFILQPFLMCDAGYSYNNFQTATDIRLIIHKNSLLQSYIRMAKKDDFRCNLHQGGTIVYVTAADIPTKVLAAAEKIIKTINKRHQIYAIDFMVANSGQVYFMEGNLGPGIDWDAEQSSDEKMSKQLIRSIVSELTGRILRRTQNRKAVNSVTPSVTL